jgi:hypothetical protein
MENAPPPNDDEIEYELDPSDAPPERPVEPRPIPPDINEVWLAHAGENAAARYTVRHLLIATAFAAVVLSLAHFLPTSSAAFITGLVVLVTMGILTATGAEGPLLNLLWWMLLFIYLILSLTAAFQG